MSNIRWFPDARKNRYAIIVVTTDFMNITSNRAAIGFDPESADGIWYDSVYTPKLLDYMKNYSLWLNPSTSTALALDNLKDSENAFFPLYRQFHATVKASPVVTNAQLEGMGFPPRSSGGHSPHPVDKYFIDISVKPLANLVLSIAFENRDTGKSTIPYYLTGAVIYYAVSDTPITDQEDLTHSRLATRSPLEMIFSPQDRGRTVYIAARWQNRRGERGPWSEIVAVIIP
jgi:hypothetical protein